LQAFALDALEPQAFAELALQHCFDAFAASAFALADCVAEHAFAVEDFSALVFFLNIIPPFCRNLH
jgi:hypothetical protein